MACKRELAHSKDTSALSIKRQRSKTGSKNSSKTEAKANTNLPAALAVPFAPKHRLRSKSSSQKLVAQVAQTQDLSSAETEAAAEVFDEGDDGTASESALSDALSEGLERILWSEEEEEQDEFSGQLAGSLDFLAAGLLVPAEPITAEAVGRASAELGAALDALKSCGSPSRDSLCNDELTTVDNSSLVLEMPPAPVLAYGRLRRRTSMEDVPALTWPTSPLVSKGMPELLALPAPAPLTALPPLSALLEACRASMKAAQQFVQPFKAVPAPQFWLYPSRLYPASAWDWDGTGEPPRQGQPGFREYVHTALQRFRTSGEEEALKDTEALPLQQYQLRVAFLMHPLSPISRLLVVHATGSGKTRSVLSLADSFYRSGKATCLFFPEEAVKENFYQELLKFPGAWRDFFCASEGVPNWRDRRHRCWNFQEVASFSPSQVEMCLGLERKVRLGEISGTFLEEWSRLNPDVPPPLAPLRAFKYTTAGGSRGGWKRNAAFDASRMDTVFRFGFDGINPMSNKNLVFDEVHNLLALPKWRGTYWREPLRRLRKAVRDCRGSSLVFLTGSPVQTDAEDGHRLLRVLKGVEHASMGDEGWLDMHMERSLDHFPRVYPDGVPDKPFSPELESELVIPVDMPKEMVVKYKEVEGQGADAARLRDCCNLAIHHSWALRAQKRDLVLEAPEAYAAKLHEVARAIWDSGEKALAAVSRRGGLQVLKELLRRYAPDDHVQIAVFSGHSSAVVTRNLDSDVMVAPAEALRRFNDPNQAEVRVLLLDTAFGREGVSALGVGQLHLVDVPGSWAEYKQTIGRAIRFGDVKPGKKRSLRVNLWASRMDDEGRLSADEALLAQLRNQGKQLYLAERKLALLQIAGTCQTGDND